ncbi:olfactory receptor 5P6-like [Pelobates fuscus]|uniref:olfactory receptor 5P6-like n=1 Tax=Pelobates fuscus TaxID=191477 RepID=UPI002FE44C9E
MAYDRYLAISNPLRYNSIMNYAVCIQLVTISWLLGFLFSINATIAIFRLDFCGPNVIDHFFCDLTPLLKLACSDISHVRIQNLITGVPILVLPLILITVSYVYIVQAVLKISSRSGRRKAFSTCSSHLTVVSIFYGTLNASYMVPANGDSLNVNKLVSLLYTVVTPMINPIIYSLRNNDIKEAIKMC